MGEPLRELAGVRESTSTIAPTICDIERILEVSKYSTTWMRLFETSSSIPSGTIEEFITTFKQARKRARDEFDRNEVRRYVCRGRRANPRIGADCARSCREESKPGLEYE